MRRPTTPTAVFALAVAAVLVSVAVAFLRAGTQSPEALVHEIAAQLRCPSCVAQSVADSNSPVSEAMRAVIVERVAEGQGRGEILGWFSSTYGPEILLDPAPVGVSVLFWIVPVALVVVAVFLTARRRRWRWAVGLGVAAVVVAVAPLVAPAGRSPSAADASPDAVAMLTSAVAADPGDVAVRRLLAQALVAAGDDHGALEEYAALYRLRPSDAATASDYAAALLGGGRIDEAELVLERLLAREADDQRALLLMAAVRAEQGDPSAIGYYRRFLELEPDSPLREAIEDEISRLAP